MMQETQQKQHDNAGKLQSVITDNLFPEVAHISDVKQVLELSKEYAQNISQEQLRAIVFLQDLGSNSYVHPNGNPYQKFIDKILAGYKTAVASPNYYLDVIEELIPKQPKPIVFAPNGKQVDGGR